MQLGTKTLIASIVAVLFLATSGCGNATISRFRDEAIWDVVPPKTEAEDFVELPSGFLTDTNAVARTFIVLTDQDAIDGGELIVEAAMSDGWSGEPLEDGNDNGLYSTTLSKDDMELSITVNTEAAFDLWEHDEDAISIRVRIDER